MAKKLRKGGMSTEDIAKELEISSQQVYRYVESGKKR